MHSHMLGTIISTEQSKQQQEQKRTRKQTSKEECKERASKRQCEDWLRTRAMESGGLSLNIFSSNNRKQRPEKITELLSALVLSTLG